MNARDYMTLVGYAGRHLAWEHPWPIRVEVPFPLNPMAAVYVAVDGGGACRNVGSVSRGPSSGLAARVAEHLADPVKRQIWDSLWILPLKATTPTAEVRRLEGVVGAHLGPVENRCLPRPVPPRRWIVAG